LVYVCIVCCFDGQISKYHITQQDANNKEMGFIVKVRGQPDWGSGAYYSIQRESTFQNGTITVTVPAVCYSETEIQAEGLA
jgi:hypothetical protein